MVYLRGKTYWIQYCHRGKVYRQSSRSKDERVAGRFLRTKLGEIGSGTFKQPKIERTTFEELAKDIQIDYQVNGRKTADKVHLRLTHLRESFGMDRAIDITTDRIKAYIVMRLEQKAASATINRELAALKRMFSLGLQSGKLAAKPYVPILKENNVRQGFFEHEDFIALRKGLPDYLRPLVTFAYFTGWRSQEIRSLQWRQVDLNAGSVRLEPGTTKNDRGRVVFLPEEIRSLLESLWEKRRLDCPYVFHRNGKFIRSFRKAWDFALKEAKLPERIFHDFRRTAVRNMIKAGIPERVAMQISGHLTRSIFDRYTIVNEADLKEAARKIEAFSRIQSESPRKVIPLSAATMN